MVSDIFGDHFDDFKQEVLKIREMDTDDRVSYLSSTRRKFALILVLLLLIVFLSNKYVN